MESGKKTGLVLEGGGMRGIYTAGVLDVFMENNIHFDGVIGVSAGAIHGCSYVSGQKGRNLRYYKKYCNDKRFMSFRNWVLTGDIVGLDFCYNELPNVLDPFDYEAYDNSGKDFYVTCSNIETGEPEYLKLADMRTEIDLIRASASLPYASKIVDAKGKRLLDGGCTDSIPVKAFRKMGYKCVVVLTRDKDYEKTEEKSFLAKLFYGKYPKFIEAMKHRHEDYNQCRKDIAKMVEEGEIFAIYPSCKLDIGRMEGDPEKIQKVYDIGVADAKAQLEAMKKWLNVAN